MFLHNFPSDFIFMRNMQRSIGFKGLFTYQYAKTSVTRRAVHVYQIIILIPSSVLLMLLKLFIKAEDKMIYMRKKTSKWYEMNIILIKIKLVCLLVSRNPAKSFHLPSPCNSIRCHYFSTFCTNAFGNWINNFTALNWMKFRYLKPRKGNLILNRFKRLLLFYLC